MFQFLQKKKKKKYKKSFLPNIFLHYYFHFDILKLYYPPTYSLTIHTIPWIWRLELFHHAAYSDSFGSIQAHY